MDCSTLRFVVPFVFGACACGSGGAEDSPKDAADNGNASVSGAAGDLVFGPSVSALGGTFFGADDGLFVLITDAGDPRSVGQRQPNTSVLLLQFIDALEGVNPPTAARAGDYPFADSPIGAALWFRVSRAYRLDGSCMPTVLDGLRAVGGAGTLDDTVRLPGGRAVGSFSADFADGSLTGTFSAPFYGGRPIWVDLPRVGTDGCLD